MRKVGKKLTGNAKKMANWTPGSLLTKPHSGKIQKGQNPKQGATSFQKKTGDVKKRT